MVSVCGVFSALISASASHADTLPIPVREMCKLKWSSALSVMPANRIVKYDVSEGEGSEGVLRRKRDSQRMSEQTNDDTTVMSTY